MSHAPEPDLLEGFPHPRERSTLAGHEAAEREFLDAYRAGRMHHAWIIGGPEGIGKATLAYRIAKFLFAHPDPSAAAVRAARDLSVDPAAPAARKVTAQSHPDLAVLRRGLTEKGTLKTEIAVEQVRRAMEMLTTTSAEGGWRVCIIDPAEELNRSSNNALLKSLEEPPARSIFLIVAHAPGRLLPTIRSRGRMLPLAPLSRDDLVQVLSEIAFEEEPSAVAAAAAQAQGSVRRAIALLDPDLIDIGRRTQALLDALPGLPQKALLDLAGRAAGKDGEGNYAEMLDVVRGWLSAALAAGAAEGPARVAPLADIWEKLHEGARAFDDYNIDRRPFIVGLFSDMAEAVARMRAQPS